MTPSVRKDVILVVDDSPDSLGMIHHALDQAGLTALVALEGEQALGIAEKMVPDLVLMDAVMPNMDGFETCRRLKRHPELAAVPVIFMTGLTDAEDVVRGLEAGGARRVASGAHAAASPRGTRPRPGRGGAQGPSSLNETVDA